MSDNTTLPPDTDTSNPETGLEGKSIADKVSNVVDLLTAKAEAEGESPTAEATSFAKFDQLVELPRRTWFAGRDARYRSLFEAAPMLRAALLDLPYWEAYRKAKAPKSTARTVESQVFDVMVVDDADASVGIKNDMALMSGTTRNVYGNVIGWLAFVCLDAEGHPITDADEAVDALKEIGMGHAMLEYISQHPPHFTTKGGRATQGTGRRPGRPRRTATATPATEAVAEVDARVAEAQAETNAEAAANVDTGLQAGPPPRPAIGPQPPETIGDPMGKPEGEGEAETRFTTSGATEAELVLRAECCEAFDTFLASSPHEPELCEVRDFCRAVLARMTETVA